MRKNKIPDWFIKSGAKLYKEGDTVTNSFNGERCELNAEELSMYDFIMGCQFIMNMGGVGATESIQNHMKSGLQWFKENNPKAYKKLLD